MRDLRILDKLVDELAKGDRWRRFCARPDRAVGGLPTLRGALCR